MELIASRRDVMGDFALPPMLKSIGWGATVVMAIAAADMFATM
jgi:Mn2+/Fe2+ NRAMP family transporter